MHENTTADSCRTSHQVTCAPMIDSDASTKARRAKIWSRIDLNLPLQKSSLHPITTTLTTTTMKHRIVSLLPLALIHSVSSFSSIANRNVHIGAQDRRTLSTTTTTTTFLASTAAAAAPTNEAAGWIKSITEPGTGKPVRLGDIATVKYACYHDGSDEPFSIANQQKVVVGDGSMIEGWEQALRTMRIGERCVVRVTDPALGYGATGVPPVVPPNAVIELELHVLDSQPASANIDFDAIADADTTPRTATDIAAAYAARQKAAAENRLGEEELTGLDAFLEKAKNFYFYGLFEGETGERPPWFLRPSITFPLAFLIVGGAFYVSLKSGAISERGAPVIDELDEIILSSLYVVKSLPF